MGLYEYNYTSRYTHADEASNAPRAATAEQEDPSQETIAYNEPYIANGALYVQEEHGGSYLNATKGQHWKITPQCRSSDNAMVVCIVGHGTGRQDEMGRQHGNLHPSIRQTERCQV